MRRAHLAFALQSCSPAPPRWTCARLRHARPPSVRSDRLRSHFETLCVDTFAQHPRTAVTHPYFGSVLVPRALLLSARHIDHHRGQLERGLETR